MASATPTEPILQDEPKQVSELRARDGFMHDFAHAYMTLFIEPQSEVTARAQHVKGTKFAVSLSVDATLFDIHTAEPERVAGILRDMADKLEAAGRSES